MEQPTSHANHSSSNARLWGLGALSGVIAAPHVLPLIGIGEKSAAGIANLCKSGASTGIAGSVAGFVGAIPVIGPIAIAGGWTAALSSAGIGLGGMMLSNYLEKNCDPEGAIPWGKIIRYTALATSLLIALPSLVSGLSVGIAYLGALAGFSYGSILTTTGVVSSISTSGAVGLSSLLPHLFTCGIASLPLIGMLAEGHNPQPDTPKINWTERIRQVGEPQEIAAAQR